ncbi:tyrosine-type recombinase/integrase [Nonomuraea sp. MTCD27]|uniref:tyrosine-type recombinase/integrase n=1 Tax=Nonomuraea sp. MTCD27 TaxID=1676747 RepID=UPI0035C189EE
MFPTAFGNPSDPGTFSHLFSRLAKKADLGHWHPHELRHSDASLMLAQGTPLHVVSEALGHASIAITRTSTGTDSKATDARQRRPSPPLSWGNSPRWLPRTPKTPVEDRKPKGP